MTLLSIRDFAVRFGETVAVGGVGLDVAPGECLAVVGESGSGKSQLCLAAFGLSAGVASGSVRFDGEELVGAGEDALRRVRGRRVGFVFQQPLSALTPHLTIGRQIAEAIGGRPSRKELARLLEISPNTVKTHVARLYEKLKFRNRVEAIEKARQLALIA